MLTDRRAIQSQTPTTQGNLVRNSRVQRPHPAITQFSEIGLQSNDYGRICPRNAYTSAFVFSVALARSLTQVDPHALHAG